MENFVMVRGQKVATCEEIIAGNEFYGVEFPENSALLVGKYALVEVTEMWIKAYRTMFDSAELFCPVEVSRSVSWY